MLSGLDCKEGARAVYEALRAIEEFRCLDDSTLRGMTNAAIDEDMRYIKRAGIENGEAYDEDAAFDAITRALCRMFPDKKKIIASFVDDYMEAWEIYLESAGLIEWV